MKLLYRSISVVIATLFFALNTSAQSVGLVMSGGGAKGIAHIGVIKALEENGLRNSVIKAVDAAAIKTKQMKNG